MPGQFTWPELTIYTNEFKYKMMVSDGNAGYCIPYARFDTSFQHIFQHWFNLFRCNFGAWNAIKSIFYEFKYKWHLMKTLDNRFQMWDVRWVSGIVSGIELVYARAMYSTGNAKKSPFMLISYVFKYKWHLMEVPDNWFRMWVVRWVSGIVSGIDFIYPGVISTPEIQKNDHLHWFSMNLSTDGVWWRVQWNQ